MEADEKDNKKKKSNGDDNNRLLDVMEYIEIKSENCNSKKSINVTSA